MGFLVDYVKPHWKQVLLIAIMTMVTIALQLMIMTETKAVMDLENGGTDKVISSGIKMLVFSLGYGAVAITIAYLASRLTATLTCNIRRDVFTKITEFSDADYDHFGGASLMTRVTADCSRMQILFINVFRDMLQIPIVILFVTIAAAFLNPMLSAVMFVAFIITVVFLVYQSRKSIAIFNSAQSKLDTLNGVFTEKLGGVRTIRAFGMQEHEEDRFEDLNDDFNAESYRAALKVYHLAPLGILMINMAALVIYYLGSLELRSGMVEISDLFLFFQYIAYFISCLAIVPFLVKTIPRTIASSARLKEVLDYECRMDVYGTDEGITDGDIEFRDVSFGYNGGGDVISGINFTVKKGTTVAFIGSTGSGKSTVVSLVNRMYDPTSGQVLIGGKDVRDMDLVSLRDGVSFAAQRTMVMNDTVYANVAMGSDISKEKAEEACRITRFSEALDNMPDGIDTLMAQSGMNVSGGQRQRLSLARAVAKDADIYVFDDCFSALDAKTEAIVRANIKEALRGRTVLMVAQKINTIRDADNIIVMDKGVIVAQGTHESLMEGCELYREFHAVQSYVSKEGS